MAYARLEYTGTGSLQTLAVSFPYIDAAHVLVLVDDVVQVPDVDFVWTGPGTIQLTAANGAAIVIVRDSSRAARMTDFIDGNVLAEQDLDTDGTQSVYMAQEALDLAEAEGNRLDAEIASINSTLSNHETRIDVLEAGGGGGGGGGAGTWGAITGTLSNQTDLQAALDAKAAAGHNHDGTYSPVGHNHTGVYAPAAHTHDGLAPAGGTAGQVLKKNTGTDYDYSWQADGGGATPSGITTTWSLTPPISPPPSHGDRWIHAATGKEYTWINDGDSEQWVETGGGGTGTVLTIGTVAFAAKRATTQQNSGTTLIFNDVVSNAGSAYDSATGIFTVPMSGGGTYLFTASAQMTNSTGDYLGNQTQIEVNGVVVSANSQFHPNGATYTANLSVVVTLAAGDAVRVTTNTAFAANFVLDSNARTRFTGTRLF